MYHHRLVLSRPFGPDQSHKVQEISGVIWDAVVRPSQVLDLGELPLLFTLNTHRKRKEKDVTCFLFFPFFFLLFQVLEAN